MTLGQMIKECRKNLEMTQKELADATQITLQHISSIEQGKRIPSLPLAIKLAEQFQTSLDYLILGKKAKIDTILAIKDDDSLDPEAKQCLIRLVLVMRNAKNK